MRICICGGGNLGHVCAGFLANRGHQVDVLTTKPGLWDNVLEIVAPDGDFRGQLNNVSDKAGEVIPQAEVVLVCLPGFAIHDLLTTIRPYIGKTAVVGTVVSSTGFFFEARDILPSDTPLFGLQRVPFISRTIAYGRKAELKGYKESLRAAVCQATDCEGIRKMLEMLFEKPVALADNFYEVSLSNSNPLLHPARLYTMWKNWRTGTVYDRNPMFYAEWTEEASALLLQMDGEFQQLLSALHLKPGSIPSILDYYESSDVATLTRKIRSIKAFQGIMSPMRKTAEGYVPDFSSRYFTEDFPYGMRFIVETAHKALSPIPTIESIYAWGMAKYHSAEP